MSTLIQELERAANTMDAHASHYATTENGVADLREQAARLRKRVAHVRKLQEQARTNPGEPWSFGAGCGFGVHALAGDL